MKSQRNSQIITVESFDTTTSAHDATDKESNLWFAEWINHIFWSNPFVPLTPYSEDTEIEAQISDSESDEVPIHHEKSKRPLSARLYWTSLILCLLSGAFLFGFDNTMVATLQPQIIESLGDIQKFSWISVATYLGSLSYVLISGELCSKFNVKWLFIAYMVLFQIGCAMTGGAPSMDILIAGRIVNSVGAMGIWVASMNLMAAVTTIEQRPIYIVLVSVAFMLGSMVGPLVSGALADSVGWRWGSYINICMAAFLAPGYFLLLPSKSYVAGTTSVLTRIASLDLLGNILWVASTTITVLAISFGGTNYAWNSSQVVGSFLCAVIFWLVFSAQQWYRSKQSLGAAGQAFPGFFFRSWEMFVLFVQTFCASVHNTVPLFLIPLYLKYTHGTSAISAAYHLLPLVTLRSIFVLINGQGMRKYGYVMPWYLVGSMLCIGGSIPFAIGGPSTAAIWGYSVLLGIGSGMYNVASYPVAQVRNPKELVPQAITFITAGRYLGLTIPITISNSIFINRADALIRDYLPNITNAMLQEVIVSTGDTGPSFSARQGFTNVSLSAEEEARVVTLLVKAMSNAWWVVVACSVMTMILSFTMKRDRLFR